MVVCKPVSLKVRIVAGIFAVALVVAGYKWLSVRQHDVNPKDTTIPNFHQMVEGFQKVLSVEPSTGHSWILSDGMATGKRLAAGLLLGIFLSILVGLLIGCFHVLSAILIPPLTFFSKIPPTAMLAVYFVLFGTDFTLFIVIIALGVFPSMTMAIYSAVNKDVATDAIYKAYTLGASHMEVVYEVIWKQIMPRIFQNIQLCIGPAMVYLIAAEWMMADLGFGYRLRIQSRLLNMNVVYVYLIVLGIAGFSIDWTLVKIRQRLCAWFGD